MLGARLPFRSAAFRSYEISQGHRWAARRCRAGRGLFPCQAAGIFGRVCRRRRLFRDLRVPDHGVDGARSRRRRVLPGHVLFPAHQADRAGPAVRLHRVHAAGRCLDAPKRHGRVRAQPPELSDVRLQPFFLPLGRLFRRSIRSEASAAHLVALDRGAVLPGLAAAVPGHRPLAISMAAVFCMGSGGDLAGRIGGHGRPPQGSRVLPRSLSGLGAPAGRRAGAPEQAAGDHGADGRALRRRRPVDDRRVCPLPG